jgi:hypothetical protein
LFSRIEQHLMEKHEKSRMEVVRAFPLIFEQRESVMLGSFSWYYPTSKRKEILRPFAYQFPNFLSTPSELSRSYLELKYTRQRATREQIENFKQPRTAPLYAQPIGYSEGAYIDIRSAYWQILQVVGWDVDYNPGKWLGKKDTMEDFPFPDFKLSRNCLVTAGLPSEASYWDFKKQTFGRVKTFNRFLNLGIWALVMDVLHCVAWDAVAAGACYVHTDGYIAHYSKVQAVQEAISSWGLESRIKNAGRTIVHGVGSYEVGDKVTKNPKNVCAPFDGLMLPPYMKWLKSTFRKHAERTNFIWSSDWQQQITSPLLKSLEPSEKSLKPSG